MKRTQLVSLIKARLKEEYGVDLIRDIIAEILRIEEEEIYSLIALNGVFHYKWGTIAGETKPPVKLYGPSTQWKTTKQNHGYTTWKMGVPKITWSTKAKIYDEYPPEEYFDLPEVRYTTQARQFREDAGFPEIPEYKGMPEEEIKKYCAKADDIFTGRFSKWTPKKRTSRLKQSENYYSMRTLYWKTTGHIPVMPNTRKWDGPVYDMVEKILYTGLENSDNPVDKLEVVLTVKDRVALLGRVEEFPELDEFEAFFRKEIEEQGLEPMPHKKLTSLGGHVSCYEFKKVGDEQPAEGEQDDNEEAKQEYNRPWGKIDTLAQEKSYIQSDVERRRKKYAERQASNILKQRDFEEEIKNEHKKILEKQAEEEFAKEQKKKQKTAKTKKNK